MTDQSEIFQAGGGGGLAVPVISLLTNYPKMLSTATLHTNQGNIMPGFVGDQDVIEIPISAAFTLNYTDASGSLVFFKNVDDFGGGNSDIWMGYFFKGSLLYVFTIDTTTAPDTFYTDTVDIAGNIVNIGNDQPANNNFNGANFNTSTGTTASNQVMQHPDGNSVIWLGKKLSGVEYLITNLSDGQFTVDSPVDPVQASTSIVLECNLLLSANGSYIAPIGTSIQGGSVPDWGGPPVRTGGSGIALSADLIDQIGIGWTSAYKPVHYQNDATGIDAVVFIHPTSAGIGSVPRVYGRKELSDWNNAMVQYMSGASVV